jgi:hypothetical protein
MKTPWDFFSLCFPINYFKRMADFTNERLNNVKLHVSTGELIKCIGLKLAMVLSRKIGGIRSYWKSDESTDSTSSCDNFKQKYSITMKRFETIFYALSIGPITDPMINGKADPWFPVRELIQSFNFHTQKSVCPGSFLCVDESMSRWKGRGADIAGCEGLPHVTKIARKPEGIGLELKAVACADTGIILGLELMEGRLPQLMKEYSELGGGKLKELLILIIKYFSQKRVLG